MVNSLSRIVSFLYLSIIITVELNLLLQLCNIQVLYQLQNYEVCYIRTENKISSLLMIIIILKWNKYYPCLITCVHLHKFVLLHGEQRVILLRHSLLVKASHIQLHTVDMSGKKVLYKVHKSYIQASSLLIQKYSDCNVASAID